MTAEQHAALKDVVLLKADGTTETYKNFEDETPVAQADLTAYNAALAKVAEADYTAESWTAYQVIVKANMVTGSNTQAEVDAATAAITAAQANLVSIHQLEVESVSAINAKELQVKFTKEVNKASVETTAPYTITSANSDAATTVTVSAAKLGDDKKTVTLTLTDGAVLNNKATAKYLVKVANTIITPENEKLKEYSELVSMYDATVPTVTELSYPDSNTVKVAFSEPVNTISTGVASATTIKLNGSNVIVPSGAFTLAADKKSFSIDIAAAGLQANKAYTIEVASLTDYATNVLTKYTGAISFATDSTKPAVTELTGKSLQNLEVVFTEKVDTTASFKVKVDGTLDAGATITNASADKKTFAVKLTAPVAKGNHVITIYDYKDLAQNAGDSYTKEVAFESSKPVLNNTVGSLRNILGTNYIVFTFDRDIAISSASISGTYVDDSSVTKNVGPLTLVEDATVPSLAKNEIALSTTGLSTGNYKLSLAANAIADTFGQNNDAAELTFSYSADVVSTTVASVKVNGTGGGESGSLDTMVVVFAADVSTEALNPSHYTIDGVQAFESAIFDGDKQNVKLTLKSGAIATTGDKTFAVSGIPNVTDKTYNGIGSNPAKLSLKENVKPEITKVELTAYDKIRVTFSEDVVNADAADFVITVNGIDKTANAVSESNGIAVLTLATADKLTSSTTPVTAGIKTGADIADATGNKTEVGQVKTATVNFEDTEVNAINALEAAIAQFDFAGSNDGALATGKTVATARVAYNAAVAAVDNHGDTATILASSNNKSYADVLSVLKAAVLIAEAEDFAKSADLTIKANYDTLFTGATSLNTVANGAVMAISGNNIISGAAASKTDLGTRSTALTTAKGEFDALYVIADGSGEVKAAKDAATTAVTTTTKTNIDSAETAIKTATTELAKIGVLAATKTKLEGEVSTSKTSVANDSEFTYVVTKGADAAKVKVVFAGVDVTDFTTAGLTASVADTDSYGTSVAVTGGTGAVTLSNDKGNDDDATYTQTITVADDFWTTKTDTVTVTITDGSGGGNDTFAVNAD
jgi:hypothetical protein